MSRPNLYDYLKVFAILTMIIDHIGYFLFPEILWLRVIGRLAFPVFFFLIGRNGSSRISYELIFLACFIQGILRGASMFMGYDLRQLNILPVAILVKLFVGGIHYYQESGIKNLRKPSIKTEIPMSLENITLSRKNYTLLLLIILFIICTPFVKGALEYGFMGFAMATFGYMVRNKETVGSKGIYFAGLFSLVGCIITNSAFPFSYIQWIIIICGWMVLRYIFYSKDLYTGSIKLDGMSALVLQLSKYAIWIYIIHFSVLLGIVIIRRG